jgi:hypothetical protein
VITFLEKICLFFVIKAISKSPVLVIRNKKNFAKINAQQNKNTIKNCILDILFLCRLVAILEISIGTKKKLIQFRMPSNEYSHQI